MAIAFACPGCKKKFKVEDDKAGRKGKCPNCDAVFQIPAAETGVQQRTAPHRDEDEPRRPRAEAPRRQPADGEDRRPPRHDPDEPPPRRRPAEEEYAEIDPEEEERPRRRRRKKKQKGSTGLILGLAGGAVAVLALLGVGLWFLLRTGTGDDLKYLPDNSEVFVTVNVDRLTGSELYKQLRQDTAVLKNFEQAMLANVALQMEDIQRVTLGGKLADTSLVAIIRSKKVVSLDELVGNQQKFSKEEEFEGYKMRHDGTLAVVVPERKTVLVGPLMTLKRVFKRGGKGYFSPGLQAAFNELDQGKVVAAALDLKAAMSRNQAGGLPAQLPGGINMPESLTGHLELGATATLSLSALCASPQEAEELKKFVDAGLASVKGPIPNPFVPREAADIFKNVQVNASGNKLTLTLSVDNNTVVEAAKKAPGTPPAPAP